MQSREFGDGPLVVVDPEVDERVAQTRIAAVALDHEQRGRLLPAPVAAGCLCGVQAVQQALRERSRARLERLRDRVYRRL